LKESTKLGFNFQITAFISLNFSIDVSLKSFNSSSVQLLPNQLLLIDFRSLFIKESKDLFAIIYTNILKSSTPS